MRHKEVIKVWLHTQRVKKEGLEAMKPGSRAALFTVATPQECWLKV